jgi:hypothetical protein
MTRFLDPTGQSTFGIALCARCSCKFLLGDLVSDPNAPGLMVCRDDLDQHDPYRLAPRPADTIVLPFNRPDVSLATRPSGLIQEAGDQFLTTEDGNGYLVP